MSTWVYTRSEPNLWTVGFYDPDLNWHPDSDHDTKEKAADRVHWLNGGEDPARISELIDGSIRNHLENDPHIHADGSAA